MERARPRPRRRSECSSASAGAVARPSHLFAHLLRVRADVENKSYSREMAVWRDEQAKAERARRAYAAAQQQRGGGGA